MNVNNVILSVPYVRFNLQTVRHVQMITFYRGILVILVDVILLAQNVVVH